MAGKRNYNKISNETTSVEDVVNEGVVIDTDGEETTPEIPTQVGIVCNCKKLNVRKNPDINAKVIKIIDAGDEVTITGSTDRDFYEIVVGNKSKGFCMKKYIDVK